MNVFTVQVRVSKNEALRVLQSLVDSGFTLTEETTVATTHYTLTSATKSYLIVTFNNTDNASLFIEV